MGKKGYNWRSRQATETIIDNSQTKNINLDIETKGHYDPSNELVLPSKKRKTKIIKKDSNVTKILSKKDRKRLEKIVEKKKKKENRVNLLDELKKAQLSQDQRKSFVSLASVQTKGLKRIFNDANKSSTKKIRIENTTNEEDTEDEIEIEESQTHLNQNVSTGTNESKSEIPLEEINPVENSANSDDEVEIINDKKEAVKENCENLEVIVKKEEKVPTVYVDVMRDPKIQKERLKLPVLAEEQNIMETINANSIVIISGETGSGKTTQIPQFLYEAGYALKKKIGITEPRRIAAISMSERVAKELNLNQKEVSYLIRFQGNYTPETKILFMTDGVLLKEVQHDFLLRKYSVLILDEAHERSLYTDLLIGLLSRIVKLREKRGDPLKIIIMSATLSLDEFVKNQKLFKIPPKVINVEARQFPVTIHFNRRTDEDYANEAFRKTCKIHQNLPDGGILVFLTGQQEVNSLVHKLRKAFPYDYKTSKRKSKGTGKKIKSNKLPTIKLDDYNMPGVSEVEDNENPNVDEFDETTSDFHQRQPLWVLPLYSMLPVEKQNKIFQTIPEGSRLCVVSTNVAETSLTIPGIKYVVDSGKTKMKIYDKITGVSTHLITWVSKASADQRAGRAGRTGPGHCYRLYSSAVFNDTFQDFTEPEILRVPLDDLFLKMKCMNIDKITNFPFVTTPNLLQLKTAETRLKILDILDKNGRITELGKAVSKFPVLPRFGKMLALSHQHDILPYTVCLVAALSVPEVLQEVSIGSSSNKETLAMIRLRWAGTGNSYLLGDNSVLLKAVGAAEYAFSQGKLENFCSENGLRLKAISEIRKLRKQLCQEINETAPDVNLIADSNLPPPQDLHSKLLRQILLSGLSDQIAKKMTIDEVPSGENKSKYKYAYHANNMEDLVYLHQGSVMKKSLPEFVVYQELYETNKIYMRGVTAIEPEWLPVYVPSLCDLSEPEEKPPPSFTGEKVMCTMSGKFGSQAWCLPKMRIEYPECDNAYKWFAKFLLNGEVIVKLNKYTKSLLSQPGSITKSWINTPRIQALLNALKRNQIRTKSKLIEVWEENSNYLLKEYLAWLPESAHSEVISIWPPLE